MTKDLFKDFFHLSPDMLCIASADGHFKEVNDAFSETLGWSADDLLNHSVIDFIHPDDVEATQKALESLTTGIPLRSLENRYRCADQSFKHLQWAGVVQQETGLLFGMARDVTSVQGITRRFRTAIEASPAAIIMVDSKGTVGLINTEATRMFGYKDDEMLGCPIEMLIPERFHKNHRQLRSKYFKNPGMRPMGHGRNLVAMRKDGHEFAAEIGLNPVELEDGQHVLTSVVDLTVQRDLENRLREAGAELENANSQLSQLARTDELTGLLNRRALDEQLEIHVRLMHRMSRSLSFLLIDFDHFKGLNDTYGHAAGDKALQDLAGIMASCSRASDLAARYGGDEFAMILPNTAAAGALKLAEKIRRQVEKHAWDHENCTISVGASTMLFPSGKQSRTAGEGSTLVASADEALYQSKGLGGNQAIHASQIKKTQESR